MRKVIVVGALLCLGGLSVSAQELRNPTDPLQGLDAYVVQAMDAWKVPGLALAIVKNDKVVFLKGYGVREVGKAAPVDEHTLFPIGSTTKAMTAAAIGILVDEGKLNWDDPVTQHLPWFQLSDAWVTREVTLRDLLSHRVGFNAASLPAMTVLNREEVTRRFRYVQPFMRFRAGYDYNNCMYTVLGLVIGAASGMNWDDFVRTRILDPLGMRDTHTKLDQLWDARNVAPCFLCDLPGRRPSYQDARNPNVAMPHMPSETGPRVIAWRHYDNIGPAGGELSSNLVDMVQWVQLQLGKGSYQTRQVISRRSIEQMHSPHNIMPTRPTFLQEEVDVNFLAYGLGWRMHDYRGRKILWHTGGVMGFMTIVGLLPQENVGLVILSNSNLSELPGALMMSIFDRYLTVPEQDWSARVLARQQKEQAAARAAEAKIDAGRLKGTQPSLPLQSYVGAYENSLYGTVTLAEEGGELVLRFPQAQVADLKHWHFDLFRLYLRGPMPSPRFVSFAVGPRGDVRQMRIEGWGEFQRR